MALSQYITRRRTNTDKKRYMYAINLTGDGETYWQVGYWKTYEDAFEWMCRNDAQIDSLVHDYGREFDEIDVIIVVVNNRKKMHEMGWNK